ncbi:hypothetical protein [Streptomyces sp. NPDC014791]|uniref:hypothetical protein n=1 Tax=Streptomyces sp. NPDC014791 TaxID=3364912 RepID=UPI0036F78E75
MTGQVTPLGTQRIGQLTGSRDPESRILLNDTESWTVAGVDLGANTEHHGRLVFYFGDVATTDNGEHRWLGWNFVLPNDHQGATAQTGQWDWRLCSRCHSLFWADHGSTAGSVCPLGGEHYFHPDNWNFVLPNDHQGPMDQPGQWDWRFCSRCHSLFWADHGSTAGSVCPLGGEHYFHPDSWNFVLPNDHQGATEQTGQQDWRYCGKCHGLFWADHGRVTDTVCPVNGSQHAFHPLSWMFFLPNLEHGAPPTSGQPDWRFCARCHGLFWFGDGQHGMCPVMQGGGIRLHPVMKSGGEFDPIAGEWPVGITKSLEAASGAFSFDGRAYVFINISPERWSDKRRPGYPQYGTHLLSKADPLQPGPHRTEFLFSPRIGACPSDESGATLESHQALGYSFVLPHDLHDTVPRQRKWRRCTRCAALFRDSDGNGSGGLCWASAGPHQADAFDYALPLVPATSSDQPKWQQCKRCDVLFYMGDDHGGRGRCRAGGEHQPKGPELAVPHRADVDNPNRLSQWRYCVKCAGLFWTGVFLVRDENNKCPKDHGRHERMGLDFALPHDLAENASRQAHWLHCGKCASLFWEGYDGDQIGGICPKGGTHEAGNATATPKPDIYDFVLPHDIPEDADSQAGWRYCGKCHGLFWSGHPQGGACPADGGSHQAGAGPAFPGFNFVLPHFGSPGDDDVRNERDWRFCARCYELVWTGNDDRLSGASPSVVRTADHSSFLPATGTEFTLVMAAFGFAPHTAFRLACMPLKAGAAPRLTDTRYYAGLNEAGQPKWSTDDRQAVDLFPHEGYTSVSASWLPDLGLWLLLYSNAHDENEEARERPVVARLARTPMDWAHSDEVIIFDPSRAYGSYMHYPGRDNIDERVPPAGDEHKGWAYGPHLLDRYTRWNQATRELDIYYLLSLSSPYQVQLMHTKLLIEPEH